MRIWDFGFAVIQTASNFEQELGTHRGGNPKSAIPNPKLLTLGHLFGLGSRMSFEHACR